MQLSDIAIKILSERYVRRDKHGKPIEKPEDVFVRVADAVTLHDAEYRDTFLDMMNKAQFMPNSPTLMNAGTEIGQLSACFVLPVADDMSGIFTAVHDAALIHQSGGGTGFSFGRLRPNGATVKSTGGVASGPLSFMRVFNVATDTIKQGGKRRGANMGILPVDHPDIMEFIHCKDDTTQFTNFNLSVGLTAEFMTAVRNNTEYQLIDPHTHLPTASLPAKEVFDAIVTSAWNTGEPGIIFLDRLNADNVMDTPIEATNPCGEQPLLPYEACNLGSINLAADAFYTDDGAFNMDEFKRVTKLAVRFLDDVIEENKYPEHVPQIDKQTRYTRKIGLGVMGLADMLYRLSIPYNSEEGIEMADTVMSAFRNAANEASAELAKERGAFPAWNEAARNASNKPTKVIDPNVPMRNATRTTIAPTGTISIICGASSGIEPAFSLAFTRRIMDGVESVEANPVFVKVAKERGFYSEDLLRQIAREGTVAHCDIPDDVKRVFVTAHDVSPEWHVRMQATVQKHTDNAVSKTVNFANSATKEDIAKAYMQAYDLGCKGITVYRDGSRSGQVLNLDNKDENNTKPAAILPRPRPDAVSGITLKYKIGCGTLNVTVNRDEEGICEVFTNLGRAGGCPAQSEATSRLVSISLRAGMDIKAVIDQLKGIRCMNTMVVKQHNKDIKVISCPDAIGRALEEAYTMWYGDKATTNHEKTTSEASENHEIADKPVDEAAKCPKCGQQMARQSGCLTCMNCGESHCNG